MRSEGAPQATRHAAYLAALPAMPVVARIAGNPHRGQLSATAILPSSLRHQRVSP
jgi:hypothetical protein